MINRLIKNLSKKKYVDHNTYMVYCKYKYNVWVLIEINRFHVIAFMMHFI